MRLSEEAKKKVLNLMSPLDFKENTLLRTIAEKDLSLAVDVIEQYGGIREYIPTHQQTCRNGLQQYIRNESDKCRPVRSIAKELGLSENQVFRLKVGTDDLRQPLSDIPE